MKIETILNAMEKAKTNALWWSDHRLMDNWHVKFRKYQRQYHAFRDRIIRTDAEKDELETAYKKAHRGWDNALNDMKILDARIAELNVSIEKHLQNNSALTKRIAELETALAKAIHESESNP